MYLTEEKLISIVTNSYTEPILTNKQFLKEKYRPDIQLMDSKILVEFDGYQHYTQARNIVNDEKKDQISKSHGWKVIRIPYFVQLDNKISEHLFGRKLEIDYSYPHGFIDEKVIFPADFCSLGVDKFITDLFSNFPMIQTDILYSLFHAICTKFDGNWKYVVPYSIWKLIQQKNFVLSCSAMFVYQYQYVTSKILDIRVL